MHPDPLELLTISQFSRLIQRSRGALYKDIAEGRLYVVKLGRSTRIPRAEAERFVYGDNHNGTDNPHEE